MDRRDHVAGVGAVQFDGQSAFVLRPSGVGQGPAGAAGEVGVPHPATGLEVEQRLVDLGDVEAVPGCDPGRRREAQHSRAVQGQVLGP